MPEPQPLVRPTLLEEYAPKYPCVKLEWKEGQIHKLPLPAGETPALPRGRISQ